MRVDQPRRDINNMEHVVSTTIRDNKGDNVDVNALKFDGNSCLDIPIRDPHIVVTFSLRGDKNSIKTISSGTPCL